MPAPLPVPSPAPAPFPAPKVAPKLAPVLVPRLPGVQVGPDWKPGPLGDVQVDPVRQTPDDAHIVGTDVIDPPGGGPRPDLPSMAKELGRIELKLSLLLGRLSSASGSCRFDDTKLNEIIEMLESLQLDVDALGEHAEPEMGPLVYISEAPADYDAFGNREKFQFDIPRLPASQFISLYLKRQAEYQHQLKIWRNHVAKRETNPKPVRIEWEQVPVSEGS